MGISTAEGKKLQETNKIINYVLFNSFRICKTQNSVSKLKYKKFLLETAGYWAEVRKEGDSEDEVEVERAPIPHVPHMIPL
jgi:hypothetical protein